MATPLQNIQTIHNQLNDLTITDPQAKLLEQFFEQSIALLEGFKDPGNDLFEPRKRTILRRLVSEQVQYQQGYWGKTDKVEKINGFMQARGQLHLLLSQALSNCQPREKVGLSGLRKNVRTIFSF